jgi:pimeloyl-ACP methyl ester carboxylesterase
MAGDTAALLDALHITRAHFVGYCMGGAVALQLALDRPDLVDHLVFAGGPARLAAPTLLITGDADVVRPERVVEIFRFLGGGVPGDLVGLPQAQLAVLPGTSHIGVLDRVDWLSSMILAFLSPKER